MRRSIPTQFRLTANHGVPTPLSATNVFATKFFVQPIAGNAGAVTWGANAANVQSPVAATANPVFPTPMESDGIGAIIYNLADFVFQTANDGDGIDVIAFLAPSTATV